MAAGASKITQEEIEERLNALTAGNLHVLRLIEEERKKTFERMIAKSYIRGQRKERCSKKRSYDLAGMDSGCEAAVVHALDAQSMGREFEIYEIIISLRSLRHAQLIGFLRNCEQVVFDPKAKTPEQTRSIPEKIIGIIGSMNCGSSLYVRHDLSGFSHAQVHQIVVQARECDVGVYHCVEPDTFEWLRSVVLEEPKYKPSFF